MSNKKKGFSLIELLAIIVILGLIIAIAAPNFIGVINNSRRKSIESSTRLLAKSAQDYYSKQLAVTDKVDKVDLTEKVLEHAGERPSKGYAFFDDEGRTYLKMYLNGYCVTRTYEGQISMRDTKEDNCEIAAMVSVTIYFNGGTIVTAPGWSIEDTYASIIVDFASKVSAPKIKRTGYTFQGWFDSNGVQVDFGKAITENITATARWEVNKYVVTLNTTGGTLPAGASYTKEVTYGTKYGTLPTPTRKGYDFLGWYTSGGVKVESDTLLTLALDHTLYANWQPVKYEITLDALGGKFTTTEGWTINGDKAKKEYVYMTKYEGLLTPKKTGYTFKGWYTIDDIHINTNTTVDDKLTAYAKWEANKYKIIFNSNGGTNESSIEVTYDANYGHLPTPIKTGYEFLGWYTSGGVKIESTSVVKITADTTLYAQWELLVYTVTFDALDGIIPSGSDYSLITENIATKPVTYDNKYGTLPVPTKIGYAFKGWFDSSDNKIESSTIVKVTTSQTLTAKWEAQSYKVSFDSNGGSSVSSISVTYDSIYGTLTNPSKKGYIFNGWATASGVVVTQETKVTIPNDHTLYAQWGNNTYIVTFDANGGSASVPTITVTYDKAYGTLATATRDGYTFKGWYYNGSKIESTTIVKTSDNHSLVASWEANKYTVTFVYGDSTTSDTTKSVTYDSTYGTLPTPTRSGYTFKGWYTTGGTKIESTTIVSTVGNHTLYAQWTANTYTITFDSQGGSAVATKTVTYDHKYGTLTESVRAGYTFQGWFSAKTGGTKFLETDTVKVTSNTTFYAQWSANSYTITFVYNNGLTANTTKSVKYDELYGELPSPTRTGYKFSGWYTSSGTKIEATSKVQIVANQTLYGQWEANKYTVTYGSVPTALDNKVVTYDQAYGTLPNPSYTGYTFQGWYINLIKTAKFVDNSAIVTNTGEFNPTYSGYMATPGLIPVKGGITLYSNMTICGIYTFDKDGNFIKRESTYAKTHSISSNAAYMRIELNTGTNFDYYRENLILTDNAALFNINSQILPTTKVELTSDHTLFASWTQNKYILTFKYNNGNEDTTKEVIYDEKYGALPSPVRSGYTFHGWSTLSGEIISNNKIVKVNSNVDVYAQWGVNEYLLTFDANGGKVTTLTKNVKYDELYGDLPVPTRDGYTFQGWFTAKTSGEEIKGTDKVQILSNTTVYAQWKANKYVVTYNIGNLLYGLDNVTNVTNTYMTYSVSNGSITVTANRDDGYGYTNGRVYLEAGETYTFNMTTNGTYGTLAGTETVQAFLMLDGKTVAGQYYHMGNFTNYSFTPADTGIYWLRLDVNKNGQTNTFSNITITKADTTKEVTYGQEYGYLETPRRIGYTFNGWYTSGGVKIEESTVVTLASNHTLFAQWTANKYTLTFDSQGGTEVASKTVTYDQKYGDLPVTTRTGYTFQGWFLYGATPTKVLATDTVKITSNTTLYAEWGVNEYTITFVYNDGVTANTTKKVNYDSTYGTLPYPIRDGYEFLGWYTQNGTEIKSETKVTITANQELYGQWQANKYTITFIYNNDVTANTTKEVLYNDVYGTLPSPSRVGYTFNGWYSAMTGGTKITSTSKVQITQNTTFYAQWTANKYTLTFIYNNGAANTTKEVTYDEYYGDLPTPTRVGYTFNGWMTSGGEIVRKDATVKLTSNTSVYAQWGNNTFVVTFDGNGGTVSIPSINVTYDQTYGTLATSTRDGYTFQGWYTAKTGGTKILGTDTVKITDNQTLYARWKANTYTVTFVYNDGATSNTTQTVTFDSAYGTLPGPSKRGYSFLGWYTSGGTQVLSTTKVSMRENHTLYGQWQANEYVVTFQYNDGVTANTTKKVTYDQKYGDLPGPSRTGYVFSGWYTSSTGGTKVVASDKVQIVANQTLYAQWSVNKYTVTFVYNDGVTANTTMQVSYDDAYGTLPSPTKTGYTFKGWYTQGGTQITSTTKVKITANQELYGQWTANKFTLVLVYGNGSANTTKELVYDQKYGTLPTPTKTGYTFKGWFTATTGGTQVLATDIVKVTANQTLYGQWTANKYTVTYDFKNNIYNQDTSTWKLEGSSKFVTDITYNNKPTVAVYSDAGIYSGLVIPLTDAKKQNTNYKLSVYGYRTASFNKNFRVYATAYKSDGTVLDYNHGITMTGSNLDAETWKQYSYTFNSKDWAKWNSIDMDFDSANQGPIYISDIRLDELVIVDVYYDGTYGTLPTPTRTGYIFNGWSTSGGVPVLSTTKVQTANHHTIYAQWSNNTYLVTFDAAGGTTSLPSKNIIGGTAYGTLPTATRANYKFLGWYHENNKVDSTTIAPASNHTLVAKWEANKATVTLVYNDGKTSDTTMSVTYDSTYGTLPTPTRTGYTFNGWYTSGGSKITSSSKVTTAGNHSLYAQWQANKYTVTYNSGNLLYGLENVSNVTENYITYSVNNGVVTVTSNRTDGWGYTNGRVYLEANKTYVFNATSSGTWTGQTEAFLMLDGKIVSGQYYHMEKNTNHTFTPTTTGVYWLRLDVNTLGDTRTFSNISITTTVSTTEVTYDQKYGNVETPTKTGYTFQGWFTAATGGSKVLPTDTVKITANQTLYAQWGVNAYTVTFVYNDNKTANTTKTVEFGKTYGVLPTPTRTGYTFSGWYTSGGSSVTANTVVAVTANQELYAQWTANKYTVTFVYNNGSGNTTKEVSYASTYGTLPSPTKTGYTFKGWYTASTGGSKITASTTVSITAAQTLYAQWTANTYAVTLSSSGGTIPATEGWTGSGTSASKTVTFDAAYGTMPKPTKKGYVFNGWATSSGVIVNAATIVKTASDHDLYAQWGNNTFVVTFDGNGGEVSVPSANVIEGEKYPELATATRPGYKFVQWINQTDLADTLIWEQSGIIDASGANSDNMTNRIRTKFFPFYPSKQYILKVNNTKNIIMRYLHLYDESGKWIKAIGINGSGQTIASSLIPENTRQARLVLMYSDQTTEISPADVELAGLTFIQYVDQNSYVMIRDNHTLKAEWTVSSYTVTLDATDGVIPATTGWTIASGSKTATKTISYTSTYGTLPTPTKSGYTFSGWYTSGGTKVTSSTSLVSASNHTLYAQWNVNKYTVTFQYNNGVTSNTTKTVTYGERYGDLPIPTRDGYTFDSWATSGGAPITSSSIVSVAGAHTLYGQWVAEKYTITFDSLGGSSVSSKTVTYDQKYGTLTSPTRSGYTFQGWFTQPTGGTKILATDTVKITNNTTLYAQWAVNSYTVTFVYNNNVTANTTMSVKYDDAYGTLPSPTRTGYTFNGWYTEGGTKITATSYVSLAENHSLYAQWVNNTYTVTYGAVITNLASKDVTFDKTYGTLPTPTRTGYTFGGWYTNLFKTTTFVKDAAIRTASGEFFSPYDNYMGTPYLIPVKGGITIYTNMIVCGIYTYDANGNFIKRESNYATTHPISSNAAYMRIEIRYNYNEQTYEDYINNLIISDNPALFTGNSQITSSTKVSIEGDHTLFAKWTPTTYTVTFQYNDGVTANTTKGVTYSETYGTLPNPSRAGYIFQGWATSGGAIISDTTIVETASNHTLYAQWGNNKYTVTYNGNGGTPSVSTKEVSYDKAYGTLATATRSGYTFKGWFTAASGGTQVTSSTIVKTTANHTIYAQWTANTYTVTANASSGTIPSTTGWTGTGATATKTVTFGNTYGTLPTPTRSGYTFINWATSGGTTITSSANVATASDHTIYAQWTAASYTVTFNNNGASSSGTTSVKAIYQSDMPTITLPTKTGYTFDGYYTDINAFNMTVASNQLISTNTWRVEFMHSANKWTKTIEGDAGVHLQVRLVVTDSTRTTAPTLQFNDLTLTYGTHYTRIDETGKWTYIIDMDITEAMVSERSHGYTTNYRFFDVEGATSSTAVTVEHAIKDGKQYYNANGASTWKYDVIGNTTLHAKWIAKNYTVTANASGGTISATSGWSGSGTTSTKSVAYGSAYGTFPNATRDGYKLSGWSLVPSEYQQVDYIESSGKQVIDTGYYWTSEKTETYIDAYIIQNDGNETLFGNEEYTESTLNSSKRLFSGLPHCKNGSCSIYVGNGPQAAIAPGVGKRFTMNIRTNAGHIDAYLDGTQVVNNNFTGSVQTRANAYTTGSSVTTAGHIFIFSNHNIRSDWSTGSGFQWVGAMRVYSFKLYDNGVLKRDFIPCYRRSDNVAGMYDLVTKKFYTTPSGAFIKGNDVSVTSSTLLQTTEPVTLYAQWEVQDYNISYNSNMGLPSGYKIVSYIESTGTQYIDTGYSAPEGYIAEVEFARTTTSGHVYIVGVHDTASPYNRNYIEMLNNGGWDLGLGASSPTNTDRKWIVDTKYSINFSTVKGNSYLEVDGVRLITSADSSTRSSDPIWIFTNKYTGTGATGRGKLYSLKIYSSDKVLVRDFIPCINPDGVAGLYDVVNSKFYTDVKGGSFTVNETYPKTYNLAQTVTLPTPVRTGYTFGGWYTSSSLSGTGLTSLAKGTIGNQTLYAKWTANTYTITANTTGGTVTSASGWSGSGSTYTKTYSHGAAYGTLPTVTKEGYVFNGWATSGGIIVSSTYRVTSPQTLYAQWGDGKYIVTLDANGGSVTTKTMSVAYGSTYGTLPTPTRTGYTFKGWYTDPISGTQVTSTTSMNRAANHVLYAQWVSDENVAVVNNVYYKSVASAISSQASGSTFTVKLLKDVSETVQITDSKKISIDLNNYTISNKVVVATSSSLDVYNGSIILDGSTVLTNSGTVNIRGTTTIKGGSTSNVAINNQSGATLTITGGTLAPSTDTNVIGNSGTVNISGTAKIESTSSTYPAIANHSGGKITISGGTITGTKRFPLYNKSGATLTITGGTITSSGSNVINNYGVTNISGTAQIEGSASGYPALYNQASGTVAISGGTITGTASNAIYNYGTVNVSGTAQINCTSASNNPTLYNNAGATLIMTGGTMTSRSQSHTVYGLAESTAKISGGTLTSYYANVINNSGILEISGTAQINGQSTGTHPSIYNNSAGTLTIKGGTITATGSNYSAYNNGGTATYTSGTIGRINF